MQNLSPVHFETRRLPWSDVVSEAVDVTLLCADVVGFTEMTERLGDPTALSVMRRVAGAVRDQAARHHGELIEIRGDSFLLAFTSPRDAVRCGLRMLRAVQRGSRANECVRLRMAIHAGDVVRDGEGYFGRSLILAHRLLSQVAPGGIALTQSTAERLPSRWRMRASGGDSFRPKGFSCDVPFVRFDQTPAPELRDERAAHPIN